MTTNPRDEAVDLLVCLFEQAGLPRFRSDMPGYHRIQRVIDLIIQAARAEPEKPKWIIEPYGPLWRVKKEGSTQYYDQTDSSTIWYSRGKAQAVADQLNASAQVSDTSDHSR